MASATYYSNTYDGRRLRLVINQTQNIANNTSTLNWTLYSEGGAVNYYAIRETIVKINGTQVYYKAKTNWDSYAFPAATGNVSGSIVVSHNTDGSLSVPIYFKTAVATDSAIKDYGGNFTLTANPRAAILTKVDDFNDEGNLKIYYSNAAGNSVDALDACISSTGSTDDIASYRAVTKTGTSYTFSLTTAERQKLRQNVTNGNSATATFYLRTKIGSNYYYEKINKAYTLINYTPTLTPTAVDTNQNALALTGNSSTIIKGFNTVAFTTGAALRKEATSITSQGCSNSGRTYEGSSGTIYNAENGTFSFYATDNRGNNSAATAINLTVIPYVKLTCSLDATIELASDNTATATLNISGNYWSGNFGETSNYIEVGYRYKVGNGDWEEWVIPSIFDGTINTASNTYSLDITLIGLDYRESITVQAKAFDAVYTTGIATQEIVLKTVPVFDWGENDFNFNVPVKVNGDAHVTGNLRLKGDGFYGNSLYFGDDSHCCISEPTDDVMNIYARRGVQINGTPIVDYITDYGTETVGSMTWQYEKWASGKAVCYGNRNLGDAAVTSAWGNLYLTAGRYAQNFPTGLFVDVPYVININSFSNTNSAVSWVIVGGTATKDKTFDFQIARGTSYTVLNQNVSFYVVGRWK